MSPTHSQEVICPIPSCDQLYTGSRAKDSLRDHMFTSSSKCEVHFREYKDRYPFARRQPGTVYPCGACNGVFGKTSCLKRHMETHKETRYPCPSCDKSYAEKRNMVEHLVKGRCRGDPRWRSRDVTPTSSGEVSRAASEEPTTSRTTWDVSAVFENTYNSVIASNVDFITTNRDDYLATAYVQMSSLSTSMQQSDDPPASRSSFI
ncbi:uncharacterized protein ASPGLDRAFT_25382 [Aspergillus glaucus CBS 516.65]|uniref:C2H2-type domain-containing protein n=1 Tax=Aspergillus glaucus CBS 516.65 TaxID=1160497 RepID=A0A1L9VLE6_ASPGL|nr:hypothetical protein ASPGLDRAFT_25382 [Aspergillus glaucus CBS 516.65]OJJ84714.1 hypothetical protein ASPGLDRAFT_25382 [Aspergillus glaucus CBS 516.65]